MRNSFGMWSGLFALVTVAMPAVVRGQSQTTRAWPDLFHQRFADYDAELRLANGRVDVNGTLERVKSLGATTYYWLIGHAATDWDDLKLFLPKAAGDGIEVWVYILPPRESPPSPFGSAFSEPFRLDFPRWAEEIARLSLAHPNLTAWVIDDFYLDHAFFTPAYVRAFQAKAKAINARLAFLPLMYPPEIQRRNIEAYRDTIDGVVVAYLVDRGDIEHACSVLNGRDAPGRDEICFPNYTPSQRGDFGAISAPARVEGGPFDAAQGRPLDVVQGGPAVVHFRERDDYDGATAGYHFKQLLIDGQVVWEADVAGGDAKWHDVSVDVSREVKGKARVTLTFRLIDKQPVGNFGVKWRLADLQAQGLRPDADLRQSENWHAAVQGDFDTGFGAAATTQPHERRRLAFISMVATQKQEFQLRHGLPATSQRIAERLRVSLQAWQEGKCDGVVGYCLDLTPQSDTFGPVQTLFHQFAK